MCEGFLADFAKIFASDLNAFGFLKESLQCCYNVVNELCCQLNQPINSL